MSAKHLSLLALAIIIPLTGCQAVGISAYSPLVGNTEGPTLDTGGIDPVMNLLGKSFDDIERLLGSPDERGYDDWLGPHYYILYRHERGVMRICSPEHIEGRIAVSIILGPEQRVLGATVGMPFREIMDMLGEPELGPDRGMDNLYYMDYYFGALLDHGVPEVFVSFSAPTVDSPTIEAFIKWESFDSHVVSNGVSSVPRRVRDIEIPDHESSFRINPAQ